MSLIGRLLGRTQYVEIDWETELGRLIDAMSAVVRAARKVPSPDPDLDKALAALDTLVKEVQERR